MSQFQLSCLLFCCSYLLLLALQIPLILRKVRPNTTYGLRIRETLSNETVWYDANAYSGKFGAKIFGSLFLFAAISSYIPRFTLSQYVGLNIFATFFGSVIWVIFSIRHAKMLDKNLSSPT